MSRTHRLVILPLMLSAASAWAGFTATFTPPELRPGMASIETMLLEESEGFIDELLVLVEETLDKPLFMAAFTGATMTSELLSGALDVRDGLVISLGSSGSVWSASYGPETIAALSVIGTETDIEAGARIQPLLLQAAFPLPLSGLHAGASLGFMKADGVEYSISSFSAGAFAGLRLFNGSDTRSALRWKGVELSVGAGYSGGTLSAVIAPGPIYQVVAIDPDGSGPLLPLSTTISVNPSIKAGVTSSSWGGRLGASTGVTLFDALGVFVGAGCGYYYGSSAISIDADEAVSIEGYLSSLVESGGDGRVIISGSTAAVSTASLAPYLSARLSLRIGAFDIAVPFVWNIPKGLGLAVAIEAHL